MLRQLNLLPLLVIPIATVSFVVSHDIVNLSWLEFGEREVPPPITETFEMASSHTGKSYSIYVQLPGDYNATTSRYPVIYVVAPSPFPNGYNEVLIPLLKRSKIPDLIVVSVSPAREGRGRGGPFSGRGAGRSARWADDLSLGIQDYVNAESAGGKASVFVAFLGEELFQRIDEQYRTIPGDRCLAGHSMGGLFAIETALTHGTLFSKYLALAPAAQWANYSVARLANEKMRMGYDPDIRLFIAAAENDTSTYVIGFERLSKTLDMRKRMNFHLRTELMEGYDHNSIVVPAAQDGLVYLYGN